MWKGGQVVVIETDNSVGAGEGNRDDKQVLDRYGAKEKNAGQIKVDFM